MQVLFKLTNLCDLVVSQAIPQHDQRTAYQS